MSPNLGKLGIKIFKNINHGYTLPKVYFSSMNRFTILSKRTKILLSAGGILATATAGVCYALNESVKAADIICHPMKLPWPHRSGLNIFFGTFDAASIRRGWEVYKQVCAACHSLNFVYYREFVDVFMSEEEAKAEAAEAQVIDGPNENGEMFTRPGKLSDLIPGPYPNEEAARKANNGAYPPDLSLITIARHGGINYLFSLLRGYFDPPAGHVVPENQYFNAYFLGGNISMPPPLYNETIEYSDGTPATATQLAKDVATFLGWCAEPETTKRRKILIRSLLVLLPMLLFTWYLKRHYWSMLLSRKIIFNFKDVNKAKK